MKALSTETRTLVSVFPGDPRADTGSKQAFVEHVETALARVVATRRHDLEDALRTHVGRGDNQVVTGLGPVVEALQQAQGATVALDAVAVGDRTLLALAGAPWVATAPEQAAGVPVIAAVPAVCALVRASVLTDAELVLVNAASLPGGAPAAALLRWPVGPAGPRVSRGASLTRSKRAYLGRTGVPGRFFRPGTPVPATHLTCPGKERTGATVSRATGRVGAPAGPRAAGAPPRCRTTLRTRTHRPGRRCPDRRRSPR